jgi:hypothetical protein
MKYKEVIFLMEYSEHLKFYLPSRDTDDIADINQISENFRTIDSVIKEGLSPATADTYGTVKVETIDSGCLFGIYSDGSGLLRLNMADMNHVNNCEEDLYTDYPRAITPRTLVDYVGEKTGATNAELTAYVDEKTAPATPDTYGTVKVENEDIEGPGIYADDGALRLSVARMYDVRYCEEELSDDFTRAVTPRILVDYVGEKIGNIETALDSIIAMQESLIGGDAV